MRSRLAWLGFAGAGLFAGCSLVAGVDRDAIPSGIGGAGGGSGGATTTNGGGSSPGSGGSSTVGSGGAGGGTAGSGGAPATCSNSMMDGDETDVDCGGSCPPCDDGMSCSDASDCTSQYCMAQVCTACGVDGDCTPVAGTYCDNGDCVPLKTNGTACTGGNECLSAACSVDAVCCDNACNMNCESCVLTGSEGTCTSIPNGQDPDNECGGPQVCDGNGMCVQP